MGVNELSKMILFVKYTYEAVNGMPIHPYAQNSIEVYSLSLLLNFLISSD